MHHPRFAEMAGPAKASVSYLVLDWVLGEDGVERWVGGIEQSDVDPPSSVPADALEEIVGALQQRHPHPTWAIFQPWDRAGRPVLAVARRPLKRVEHPLFDLHGGIELPFAGQTASGLPEGPALDRLRAFEDHLTSVGGESLLLAAHETHAGRRTIHLYCDSQGTGRSTIDGFLGRQRWPGARVEWDLDPGWEAVRPYR